MLGNNGNQLAEIMHKQGILKDNMTLDECANEAKKDIAITDQHHRWLNNDDFWGDFAERAYDLGYKLKY